MKKSRIVVKIGSSSLTDEQGNIVEAKVQDHVSAIARMRQSGHEVIVVSSGAIAAGFRSLGYTSRPRTVAAKQASAAVGQSLLIQKYISLLAPYGLVAAQMLLTKEDFYSRGRFYNFYTSMSELLRAGAIPIINENDSISIEELTYGDNDMLSALVSGFTQADALIILTDIDGLYDSNPNTNPKAKRFHFIPDVSEELLSYAGDSHTSIGTGGMRSKLLAARKALSLGVPAFVGNGSGEEKLLDILEGKGSGTYIGSPFKGHMQMKKQWLAHHAKANGTITVDAGAERAILTGGKSLLPAGVLEVDGLFHAMDVVTVVNEKGETIGKGQVFYSSVDLEKVKGRSSAEAKIYSINERAEVIHRDNWVTMNVTI
ncbi:glutamate 5-kinase [Bacillus thermotolerans]|uniref:Glutamate 5-kinase n=1 Tax=Bacillus thermotolerans TaxID=1221996 RepID=A0A0F5HUX3_BACTR|nr:glutamate 5-kinase [Bacillus thermotolerans]KKB36860.1 Glutamate 5-kinase [Bacillus thermotolerans]